MTFNPQNFERISALPSNVRIRDTGYTTLILIKTDGKAWYAKTRGAKDEMVEKFETGDLLLWAWVGIHHTSIFQLDRADLEKWYR